MMDTDDDARYGKQPPHHYYGKYAGLVADNGPPPSGAHRGQVKVKVLGILEETPDGNSNQPVEVLADPAFLPGFFFVPENGARVWVEFVAGDINYPIWTGVWYPEGAAPLTADPGQATQSGSAPTLDQKVIRTKSGQVIELDDTSGSERIVIKDEKNGNLITLDSNGITITAAPSGGNVTLVLGQNKVTLDSNGVAISAPPPGATTITDGTGAAQAVVLGGLLPWLLAHTHVPPAGAPVLAAQLLAQITAGQQVVSRVGG